MTKTQAVRSYCSGWYRAQRNRVLSCLVRPTLWGLAIIVALFPALQVSKAGVFDFDIAQMARMTNAAGFFRDFFYITIVIAILALSNMLDSVLRSHNKVNDFSVICFVLLGAYFIYILLFGTSHFIEIATIHEALNERDFAHDYNIIRTTMLAGLATEIIIALREPAAQLPVDAGLSAVATGAAP